jgi:trigger factor
MKTELTHVSETRKKLEIEIEAGEVGAAFARTLKQARKQMRIPGYRPGKAPVELIRTRLGNGLHEQVGENLVEDFTLNAVQETGLDPIGGSVSLALDHGHDHDHDHEHHHHGPTPAVEGEPYRFEIELDVMPRFEVKGYTGLKVTRDPVAVTEDEVNAELDKLRESMARLVTVEDRPSEKDDHVEVEIEGREVDGDFEIERRPQMVPIGAEETMEPFRVALEGKREGDEFSLEITYEEGQGGEELQGKTMRFSGKVTAVKQREIPELDDDLARQVSGLETVDELRDRVREVIESRKNQQADEGVRSTILETLLEAHEFEAPKSMVEQEFRSRLESLGQRFQQSGIDPRAAGIDMDKIVRETREESEKSVRRDLLLDAIARKENLTVTPPEVDRAIEMIAREWGSSPAEARQQLQTSGGLNALRHNILKRKCLDWLQEQAEIC